MIFLTLGTYPLPFDRLVKAIDKVIAKGLIKEKIFAQIGLCDYRPRNMEYTEILEKGVFDSCFREAAGIISHAGIGTITMALHLGKPLLVLPRRKCFGEHVNDHQLATAKKYEELGHVIAAYDENQLMEKINFLDKFVPRKRENQSRLVAERVARFLNVLAVNKGIDRS